MLSIYHNPRCSKSREALQFLEDKNKEYKIIKYLDTSLSVEELKNILKKLHMAPGDLVRVTEDIWKTKYKDKDLSDEEIIKALSEHPALIKRPIVINGNRAVVARPAVRIEEIL